MSKTPVELRIIIEGLIAGILAGVAIITGISIDEGSLSILILKTFCEATEGMTNSFNCWGFVFLLSIIVILMTITSIVMEITRVDDWKVGLTLYGIGFIAGVLLILLA